MSSAPPKPRLLREQHGPHARVGYIELFFDLVFVFAITQLSHYLLQHRDWIGALQTAILFLAVWWAWIYTTWATNWIDPEHGANRLVLGGGMIISLVMSSAIPKAFDRTGLAFAVAYVVLQLSRTAYVSWVCGEWRRDDNWGLVRVGIWFAASAPFWIIGGLADDVEARMVWWAGALAIESVSALVFYRVPWLGRSTANDWSIAGGHMAERCALFIIIALGEGVLITGATFGGLAADATTILAFLTAFIGSFAMWWVYFDIGAKRGAEHIEHHALPGIVGRDAFTYWHIPIVAGIILMAVADELTLAHPLEAVHGDFLLVTAGGMGLFLIGVMTFKRISSGNNWFPPSHMAGLWLVAVLVLWGWLAHPPTLYFYMGSTAIFMFVALWEWGSYHGGWIERMERRNWWLGRALRRYTNWRLAGLERRRKA
jgi:low temperature requirement protein LtrA